MKRRPSSARARLLRLALAALALPMLPLSAGCAHEGGPEARQLAQLREDIRRVQTDHDRIEQRLVTLEVQASGDRKPLAAMGPVGDAPKPRVVRLRPDGTEEQAAAGETASMATSSYADAALGSTEDGTPRPSIRVTGSGARASRGGRAPQIGGGGGAAEQIEQTEPDDGAPRVRQSAPRPSALDPEAKRAYDAALALVNARQYDRALEAFAGFLVRYPDHPNADNALYWRGECYFAQGDFTRAAEQFDGAITRFPLGNKVPDALLKLGLCQSKLGLGSKAKITFEKLAREYPRSEAARRLPREETP